MYVNLAPSHSLFFDFLDFEDFLVFVESDFFLFFGSSSGSGSGAGLGEVTLVGFSALGEASLLCDKDSEDDVGVCLTVFFKAF